MEHVKPSNDSLYYRNSERPIVAVVNNSGNIPKYATDGSSGADLYAAEEATLMPFERKLISTGIRVEIPRGYEGQVRSRSGMTLTHGLIALNAPGTIDSDYSGPVGVILYNASAAPVQVTKGMRIAQLVIAPVAQAKFVEVEQLSDSERGTGGFGHTGTH